MVGAGGGAIVNNSSIAAVIGFSKNLYDLTDRAPSSSYYVSKAGVDAFTRYTASMGQQHDIRVNCVGPGQILTPMEQVVENIIASSQSSICLRYLTVLVIR